jgi:hypothetical protein
MSSPDSVTGFPAHADAGHAAPISDSNVSTTQADVADCYDVSTTQADADEWNIGDSESDLNVSDFVRYWHRANLLYCPCQNFCVGQNLLLWSKLVV